MCACVRVCVSRAHRWLSVRAILPQCSLFLSPCPGLRSSAEANALVLPLPVTFASISLGASYSSSSFFLCGKDDDRQRTWGYVCSRVRVFLAMHADAHGHWHSRVCALLCLSAPSFCL